MTHMRLVGLGPGSPDLLTRAAERALVGANVVVTSNTEHPVIQWLKSSRIPVTYLGQSKPAAGDGPTPLRLARHVVALARDHGEIVVAVPGHPIVDWLTGQVVVELAQSEGLACTVVPGLSYWAATMDALGFDLMKQKTQFVDVAALRVPTSETEPSGGTDDHFRGIYRDFDPTRPALVGPIGDSTNPDTWQQVLSSVYPPATRVTVVAFAGDDSPARLGSSSVGEVARHVTRELRSYLYVEPIERLADAESFDTLRYVVARLRGPGGCPWDREQTYHSVKKHLIEETYEAIAAVDNGDFGRFSEELGDVLLQVVMYAQFGREAGDFRLEDVLRAVNEKLVRRHPHVFGDVAVGSSAEVLRNWERIKRSEKPESDSHFGGIPIAAPALMRANAILSRAERHGLPLRSPRVFVDQAEVVDQGEGSQLDAIGAALFDLVAIARRYRIDPEEALRVATGRFQSAFDRVLDEHNRAGIEFSSLSLEERLRRLVKAGAIASDLP